MPLLFSYGTLRDPDVQRDVFGRTLASSTDRLPGFERFMETVADPDFVRTSGSARHAILRPTTGDAEPITGEALEVTAEELMSADRYEPAGYRRVEVTLASRRSAWVYVDARYCQPPEHGGAEK